MSTLEVDNLSKICRVCLMHDKKQNYYNIFTKELCINNTENTEENIIIYAALETLTSCKFDRKFRELPQKVCGKCLRRIIAAYMLKVEAEKSQQSLMQIVRTNCLNNEKIQFKPSAVSPSATNCDTFEIVTISDNVEEKYEIICKNRDPINTDDDVQEIEVEHVNEDYFTVTKKESANSNYYEEVIETTEEPENLNADDDEDAVAFLVGNDFTAEIPEIKTVKKPRNAEGNKEEKRKYECTACKKSFLRKSNLVDHLRLHANVRLYKCKICDKSFVQAGNYRSHMRTHTKEKPYACNFCEKSYSQSSALTVHIRGHTNERKYKCTECGKCFTNASDLGKHKRVHDPSTHFKCEPCNRTFAQKINYRVHLSKFHDQDLSETKSTSTKQKPGIESDKS